MNIDDVIEAYRSTVYGIALTRVKSRADAEDIFQEVFLAYFRRNLKFNDAEHLKAWLINATLNCTKKCLRQRARAGVPMEELDEGIFSFDAPEDTALYDALCALPEPDQMVPSEGAVNELRGKIEAARPAPRIPPWPRALSLAACLLLVFGVTLGALRLFGSGASMYSRFIPIENLQDFFDLHMDAFVLARVAKMRVALPGLSDFPHIDHWQKGRLEILEWAYGQTENDQAPATVKITQYVYREMYDKLLRKGAVYLLPLWEDGGVYYPIVTPGVLFEVDERDLIDSHSDIEDFTAYDGRPYGELLEDVRAIVRDDPLLPEFSRLASMLCPDSPRTLAEVTITGPETLAGEEYGHTVKYRPARLEHILFTGSQGALPAEFSLKTSVWREDKEIATRPGERYLLFIDQYEGEFLMVGNGAARVNAGGAITPVYGEKDSGWNSSWPFTQLAGMTVEQVQALVEKAAPSVARSDSSPKGEPGD